MKLAQFREVKAQVMAKALPKRRFLLFRTNGTGKLTIEATDG